MLKDYQIDDVIYDSIMKYADENQGAFGCSRSNVKEAVIAQGGDRDDSDFIFWLINRIAVFTLNMSSNEAGIKIDYFPEKDTPLEYM